MGARFNPCIEWSPCGCYCYVADLIRKINAEERYSIEGIESLGKSYRELFAQCVVMHC